MENYERELLIYRIGSRYLPFNELEIRHPTIETLYKAQQIYNQTYLEADGIMDSDDMLLEMLNRQLITQEDDQQLEEVLPKHLEKWKIDLYQNFNDDAERERIEKYIGIVKKELNSLYLKKHAYDHLTIGGVAMFSKWYYIIENSTFRNNVIYDFSEKTIVSVLEYYNKNSITEEMIRDVAKNDPWRSIWSASKKNGNIFPVAGIDMTDEQRRLINWSSLYDNIQEYEDCPSDEVVQCDDALDGWLLLKKKDRESKKNQSEYKSRIEKFSPDAEVFIPVKSKKEAEKVYSTNSIQSRNIIKSRLELIANKGEVKDLDFTDIKLQARIAQNRAYIQSRKDR
jgi:hypothetical protein